MNTEIKQYAIAKLKLLHGPFYKKIRLDTHYDLNDLFSQVELKKYRFFWIEEIEQTIEYGEGIITYTNKVVGTSPKYFINAYIETYEDVCVNNQTLAKQMENLGWTHIARNIGVDNYWTEPFCEGYDKLVDFKGDVIEV